MVNLHRSVDEACERLVSFASACPVEVQSIQGLQFALADFDAELSMALASADTSKSASSSEKDAKELALPKSLHSLTYHKETFVRTVGWRALTQLVKSQAPIDIFGSGEMDKEEIGDEKNHSQQQTKRHKGKVILVHLVRALDGGGGSLEEHLEALQLVLALSTSAKHIHSETCIQDSCQDSGLWSIVLPSIVQSCDIGEDNEEAAPQTQQPYNPRILLTSLQVLRNIAIHLPHRVRSLKHIKPLLYTLCTLSFLDLNSSYALHLEESQREAIALASEHTLSSLLSNVTVRRNLGWDISSILGPIISPFMNIAIAQFPDKEEDIYAWDQADTLRILPHCMKGLFRLSRSWTGTYLLTKHTKAEKSMVQVLVQALGDAKGNIVRCAFVILFSGLLGMPVDKEAAQYWIENTGVELGFDDSYFNGQGFGSMVDANAREGAHSSSSLSSEWDGADTRVPGAHGQGNVAELANRVRRSILTNAIFEAGLHFHLKNAMKEKFEPKKSIPLLLERILEIAHTCLTREKVIRMQGSHNEAPEKAQEDAALEEEHMGELPDISYVVSQSEVNGDSTVSKLQRIIWSSNASSTNSSSTASDERKTLVKTLKDSGAARAGGVFQSIGLPSIEESDLRQSNQNDPVVEQKMEQLQQLMEDSLVLKYSSAYWKKWNWEYISLILDFCKGMPEEGIKVCMRGKLLKRIFAFYAKRLPSVPIENYKGRVSVNCGMKLVRLMIETEEGRNFLSGKSSFLDQLPEVNIMDTIAKGLLLEAGPTQVEKGRIFHPAMVKHTHAFGLLQMILQIGDKRKGIQMLYQLGVVQALEGVLQCKSNPELCKMIFNQLNLFINDFPQKLVSDSLASDSSMFSHAILCLKRNLLLLPEPKDLVEGSTKKTVAWFARVIVSCIESADHSNRSYVAILAAKFCSLGYTKYLFTAGIANLDDKLRPFPNLVQYLLLHEDGFDFVCGKGWLEDQVMSQLSQEKTTAFIGIVNSLFSSNTLRTLQSAFHVASGVEKDLTTGLDGVSRELYLKNVFYCLGCTERGIDWLVEHQVIQILVKRLEDDDEKDVNKKAYLWYLALIASAGEAAGKEVIEGGGIDEIQFIAANSNNFMTRGEALVALNIACNTSIVENHLKEKHPKWVVFDVDQRIKNTYTKLCLPRDVNAYLNLPRKKTMTYIQGWCASHRRTKLVQEKLEESLGIDFGGSGDLMSSAFGKLGNPIAEDQGKLDLAKLKRTSPDSLTMLNSSVFLHQLFMTMEVPKSARHFMWDVVD